MSPANFKLIADALDDYVKKIGIDLTKYPHADALRACDSPNAVLELLQGKAQAFKDYRDGDRKLIGWLKPVVEVVHGFSGVLGQAISLVPFPPASAIFVSVDVLLSAAIGVSSSYDSLVDLFECLENFLKRLEIYTAIPFTPLMTDIIVKIMVELLSVLALATKQVQQGRLKKFAKKLLGEGEIEAVLQKLERLTQEEARMMAAQTLEVVHCLVSNVKVVMDDGKASIDGIRNILVTMQGIASEINKMKRDQLQKDARNWISPPDPSKNFNIACDLYQDGTGLWFSQGGVFSEWCAKGALLWIHGKPGSGKTFLLSAIIRDIDNLCAAGLAVMAYYYFDFRDTNKQHRRGLLSSLLCQLCAVSDPCYEILFRLYSNKAGGTREPSEDDLTKCLVNMLRLEGQPAIYIIVDALDECPNSSGMPTPREKVLVFLEKLIEYELPNVHICVSSRPEFDIQCVLKPLARFRVSLHDESGQKKDVQDYLSAIIDSDPRMRKWGAEEKQLVIDTLSERADGMFRWVYCQLETLRHSLPGLAAIRRTLDELPETLDETYEHILLRIEKAKRNSACRLFQFLAVAIRPLRVEELAEVLGLQFNTGKSAEYRPDWRRDDSHEDVLTACASLITVVKVADGSEVIQFSHFSVKEFLTSERLATAGPELSRYHVVPHLAHTLLAQACLGILLHLDDGVDKDSVNDIPLALYAAQHWIDHCQFENVSSTVLDDMERLFDRGKPQFASWVWLYDMDQPWKGHTPTTRPENPDATPLYYAVLCGIPCLVERLVSSCSEGVISSGGLQGSPLQVALFRRQIDIAMFLLQHGADVNAMPEQTAAPLHVASESGRLDIVQLLIEQRADVNLPTRDGETPLFLASMSGELEVVRLLLQSGADVTHCDNSGQSPVYIASQNGHLEAVRLLLDSGAPIDVRDNDGWSPLGSASQKGHSEIVRLLLDHGADVDCQDAKGWAPLHIACSEGHFDIVRQLFDHGADASICDYEGGIPFHRSLLDRHLEIVRFFIARGTEIDSLNGAHRTALTVASFNGQVEMSRFLIEHGANVHFSDNDGWTPLSSASAYGHLDIVRLLLDHGADPNSQKGDLWNSLALHLASANGHLKTTELLIERGADVHKQTDKQQTPLACVSAYGHLEVARFLLNCGSNVDSRDSEGRTPLHYAARGGHLDTVKLLLESGADIDVRNSKDESPLYLASVNGMLEVARFLAERMGVALPEIASQSKLPDVDGMTLHTASEGARLDVVRALLDPGEDVNTRNDRYRTPLHVASEEGKLDIVRLLIDRGADVNCRDKEGCTPLHLVSQEGHLEVARLLLDRGADVNAMAHGRWTSLHMSSASGYLEIVLLLLERGIDVNAISEDGRTASGLARARGNRDIEQELANHGKRG